MNPTEAVERVARADDACVICGQPPYRHSGGFPNACPIIATYRPPSAAALHAMQPASISELPEDFSSYKTTPPRPTQSMIRAAERQGYDADHARDMWIAMYAEAPTITTYGGSSSAMQPAIDAAVLVAVEAERRRCIGIVDNWACGDEDWVTIDRDIAMIEAMKRPSIQEPSR